MAMSLVSAASLAMTAVAGANVVVRPTGKNVNSASRFISGKRPYLARRRPGVGVNGTELVLLGGGATLPAIAYVGVTAATGAGMQPAGSLVGSGAANPVAAGSVLGVFDANAPLPPSALTSTWLATYAQTGSGFGKGVLNGSDAQPKPAPQLGASAVPGTNAFNGDEVAGVPTNTGSESQADTADFAGSDAPLKQSEYSALTTNIPGRGEFVQVPYVAGAVAIGYNNPDVTGQLNLTSAEIDGIASGTITNWDQISTNPLSNTAPKYPSRPITFVFRKDNSGTTFAFTNYLSGKDSKWGLTQTFVDAVPQGLSGQNFSGFVAASGNPGIVNTIDGTPGSIGYAEAGNLLAALGSHPNTHYARVYSLNLAGYNQDPIQDLPAAAKTVALHVVDQVAVYASGVGSVGGSVIGGVTVDAPSGSGRPSPDYVALSPAPYLPGAVWLVDPKSYAAPYAGYPIIAVSYLEFYSSGNGIYTNALRYLAQEVSNPASYTTLGLNTIDPNTTAAHGGTKGFAQLGILNLFYTNAYIGIDRFIN
jgi:phosphate transport system substrate-binding protein